MNVVKAPTFYHHRPRPWVFLAGSIEMGTAENWQERVTSDLHDLTGTILNPRRDDWDSSWVQSIENDQFREQVIWELQAQHDADQIFFYFSPGTKSPITLLELGCAVATRGRSIIVCCPDGFWRKGNVDILCSHHSVPVWSNYANAMVTLGGRLKALAR